MTVDELLTRIRSTSVVDVLNTIASTPDEAADFIRTLGPHLVAPLMRQSERKQGVVALTSGGRIAAPRHDWTRLDWKRWTDWMGTMEQGVRAGKMFGTRVLKAFGTNKQLPYSQLRAKLNTEDADRLDKLCGKVLAA